MTTLVDLLFTADASQIDKATQSLDKNSTAAKGAASGAASNASNSSKASAAMGAMSEQADKATTALNGVARSHAGVNRELLVLAHELSQGNYTKFGGSLLVLGERTDALGAAFRALSVLGVAGGIALGVVAGAAAAVGVAFYQGHRDALAFGEALATTNNYSNLTSTGFKELAGTISGQLTVSYGKAAEALMGIAKTGQFTGAQSAMLTKIILNDNHLTGASIEDLTKEYTKLAEGPGKFLASYNRSHNVFTPAQQEEIRLLIATGQEQKAVTREMEIIAAYQNGEGGEALKAHIGLWDRFTASVGNTWHAMKLGVGAEEGTLKEQMDVLVNHIALAKKHMAEMPPAGKFAESFFGDPSLNGIKKMEAELVVIQEKARVEKAKAEVDSHNASLSKQAQADQQYWSGHRMAGKTAMDEELKEFDAHMKTMNASGTAPSKGDQAASRQEIIDRNTPKVAKAPPGPDKQEYQAAIAALDGYITEARDKYKLGEEWIKVELLKGQINEEDATKKVYQIHMKDLEDERIYQEAKYVVAKKEEARTKGLGGTKNAQDALNALKHIRAQEALAEAEEEKRLAQHAEKIKTVNDQMALSFKKSMDARKLANDRALNKSTMSSNEADKATAFEAIADKYAAKQEQIKQELDKLGASASEVGDAMANLKLEENAELAAESQAMDKRIAAQQSWSSGWKKAWADYAQDAQDNSKTAGQVFSSVTSNMGNALSSFVTTGKLDFKGLAASIIGDLAKIAAEKALVSAISMMANGGAFAGGVQMFATGGVVSSPTAFGMAGGGLGVMGEAGPEAIMPLSRGADGKLGVKNGGGGGATQTSVTNNNMSVSIGSVDSEERKQQLLKALHDQMVATSKQTLSNEMRQGGMLNRKKAA